MWGMRQEPTRKERKERGRGRGREGGREGGREEWREGGGIETEILLGS